MTTAEPIEISGEQVRPGERKRIEIPVARLPTDTWLSLPIEVIRGKRDGARLWLSAAVHGDELNGVEVVRQVLESLHPGELSGTLIAAPIVNVFGVVHESRYLPDRRDLNRSFPGSPHGSLAARLAHLVMTEIVARCTHGIDLHTGSNHRTNLPQIRGDLSHAATRSCAEAFGAPVMIDSHTRDGSLRHAAGKQGKVVLLYEAGEPLRFEPEAIRVGVAGVRRVMASLHMLEAGSVSGGEPSLAVETSRWVRARRGGLVRIHVALGQRVDKGDLLATVSDTFGHSKSKLRSPFEGIIIGHTNHPFAYQGDAIIHAAKVSSALRP